MGALKSSKCSRGHKLEEPNLYWRKNGQRECKLCKGERNREQEAKRKALKPKAIRKGRGKAKGPKLMTVRARILAQAGQKK